MNLLKTNTFNMSCKNISIIFLFLYFAISSVNAATLKINNGFESGDLGVFKCHGNCPKMSTLQKKSGKYSANFVLTRNMSTNYRSEILSHSAKRLTYFNFSKEYWISLDYRREDWAKDSNAEIGPFQVHTRSSNWSRECHIGSAVGTAPFLMFSHNGEAKFNVFGKLLAKWPVQIKKWQNITIHFNISKGSDGFVEAWKDGVKLGRINGANSRVNDPCGKPMRTTYFNAGIYKWAWKRKSTDSVRRELFIDNIKIAEGPNGYSLVSSASPSKPVASHTPTTQPNKISTQSVKKDVLPLVISNIQAAVTGTSATITWNTNEASSSFVKYGLNNQYGLDTRNNLLVTSHKMILKNLKTGKVYHYQIYSRDGSRNSKVGPHLTFTVDSLHNVTKQSLVAHWPMNTGSGVSIADKSGNRNTGKLINGAHLIAGEGAKFDGVNDYFDAGNLSVGGNQITLSAWVWSDKLTNCNAQDCRIISKATGAAEQDHYFMVSTIKVGSKTRLRFRLKTNGKTSTLIAASGDIAKNQWIHVTASYDGKTMRLYKDGAEIGSKAKRGNITTNSKTPVWIGGNPSNATLRPWKGHIGDVRIYNYAMNKLEISRLANSEVPSEIDMTAPKMSNIQVAMTDMTATISWNTNKASSSIVKYGLSNRYGLNVDNGLLLTNHKVVLKNLKAGKQYHYQISSKGSNTNIGGTKDLIFTTELASKEGLVAHWLMDTKTGTSIADKSGNGHIGKLMNGARLITREGIKFDGVNDYLNVGNLNVSGKAISLSAWFWADDLANCKARDCRIISKATSSAEQSHYFMVSTIKVGNKTRLRFRLKTNGRTSTLIATSGNIVNNQWVHVVAVYDGQTMRLYKDGVEVGSKAKAGSITTNSKSPVWIGGNPSGSTSRPWKGHIGDVRIYSYPLTNVEISKLSK